MKRRVDLVFCPCGHPISGRSRMAVIEAYADHLAYRGFDDATACTPTQGDVLRALRGIRGLNNQRR